jgi:hypothetical protein
MTLIVEDGTARVDAESYASVAETSTYFQNRGQGDAWDKIDEQEAALRLATTYMEEAYRMRWKQYRVTSTQALSWPRAWVTLPDAPYGYGSQAAYVPNNVVPKEVKQACMELALRAGTGDLAPDLERAAKVERIGPIEVQYDDSSPYYTQFRSIDLLLAPYLMAGGMSSPLVRT